MKPIIVEKPAMTFVGLEASFIHVRSPDYNGQEVIGPLWGRFLSRREEIQNSVGEAAFGVIYGREEVLRSHPHELQYIACLLVNQQAELPAGMITYTVPASKYACFTHKGVIQDIGNTVNEIYDGFLKQGKYAHAGVADIELYDDRFCMDDTSEMEYWVSIKQAD